MFPSEGRSALLVVDMQQGMFDQPDLTIHEGDELLARIGRLIMSARAQGVSVIYTQYSGPTGSPLGAGSDGFEIHPAVAPRSGDIVVRARASR